MIEKRIEALEAQTQNEHLIIVSSYVEPDGTESPVAGFTLSNGEKINRLPGEDILTLEERAISAARAVNPLNSVSAIHPI